MTKGHKNPDGLRNVLDDEAFLLEYFRAVFEPENTLLLPEDKAVVSLLETVLNEAGWKDCTAMGEGVTDFVNEATGIMLEVMRIDDHESEGITGGVRNHLREKEGNLLKDRDGSLRGVIDALGGNRSIFVNTLTDWPTEADHNYGYYLNAFQRIVRKHADKAVAYRLSNPGKKLVFFVFDESSGYFALPSPRMAGKYSVGDGVQGRPHLHFVDEAFIESVRKCGADYFIWFTPFKRLQLADDSCAELPMACVLNCAALDLSTVVYDAGLMMSAEE